MNKILVIEDEEAVRANLVELLDAEGFQVLSAADGQAGVSLAREHLPDIILCDIMMPGLDGYGVLEALRQDPATATLPFVFLSARADRSDMRQGMNLGADDYLTKPFTREELLQALSTRLVKQAVLTHKVQARLDELRSSIALALPHEMRTPLTSILGYAEILAEDCTSMPPAEIRGMALSIQTSAQRLHSLILNFLLYEELEISARDPAYARAFLGEDVCSVRSLVEALAPRLAQSSHREGDLKLELEEGIVDMAVQHVQKIIEELLSNAFKFSPPGTPVVVSGHLQGESYTLSIQDHGRGMTARQIAEVGAYLQFERNRHEQQGSGLGLTITKRLVELKGGQLQIESVYGNQTTVHVMFPKPDGSGQAN
jgi:two-component system sensor histidine kinase/response regulator